MRAKLVSFFVLLIVVNGLYAGHFQAREVDSYRQGRELMIAGEWENAEGFFRTAIRDDPENPLYHIALIFALSNERRPTDIESEVRECARLRSAGWLLSIKMAASPSGIAYVYTDQFRNKTNGILKYVQAVKKGDGSKISVAQDIGKALDQFASEHSIGLIVDANEILKLREKVEMGIASDITMEFIKYYNERNSTR